MTFKPTLIFVLCMLAPIRVAWGQEGTPTDLASAGYKALTGRDYAKAYDYFQRAFKVAPIPEYALYMTQTRVAWEQTAIDEALAHFLDWTQLRWKTSSSPPDWNHVEIVVKALRESAQKMVGELNRLRKRELWLESEYNATRKKLEEWQRRSEEWQRRSEEWQRKSEELQRKSEEWQNKWFELERHQERMDVLLQQFRQMNPDSRLE